MHDAGIASILQQLRSLVDAGALNADVLNLLLPGNRPYDFETQLWDYKLSIPTLAENPTGEHKDEHKAAIAELVKDALAFHNAYGGYILFGVSDKGNARVLGCDTVLDAGEFNKTLAGYTGCNIECLFRKLNVPGTSKEVGLLLVPRRATGAPPVKFRKKGPEKATGRPAFLAEIYVRVRDECRPATNTHDDWLFLHSDRSAPETFDGDRRPAVATYMPARDPDLVEFVGREEQLATLRSWITDWRSPVRLLTGIGGLGKTTLAYRFAEEEVETGGGNIEWVIWLTAKQQTYSALQGKLVATGNVDFTSLDELLGEILRILSHELPQSDEEHTLDETVDRTVEALSIIPCLIVVDDIDSLPPDQQRETVAALNSIALRTVGREMPPSRVLMTSRVDQGLPPTSVLKVSGLDESAFKQYIENICELFGLAPFTKSFMSDLYEATSGSPLFGASIARLIRLGESPSEVLENWRGQDGEDVRRFAFEREIERLTTVQARLLYAVLLLGETSLSDLAQISDLTPRAVRDRINELQAYHLLSTAVKDTGDAVIKTPDELSVVTDILREHLGSTAGDVEEACARASERSRQDDRSIGHSIRVIVQHWTARRTSEAVVLADQLKSKFPKNGDVASIYGAALLKTSPPRWRDADRELEAARKLGCDRPELIPNIVQVKTALEDWTGLYNFTRKVASRDPKRDPALDGYILAASELLKIARARRDYPRMAEIALQAVDKLSGKIERVRLDPAYFQSISSRRFDFARTFVGAVDANCPRPGDKVRVFEAAMRLVKSGVILRDIIRVGVNSLKVWWSDVERRPAVDTTACSILSRHIAQLESLARDLPDDAAFSAWLDRESRSLSYRGAELQAQCE
jgi:hypothetical protein